MDLINGSVTAFTEQLASPAPVPGGGGACALVGAVGIALGDMVGELTVGKKKFADVEADLRALMARAQDLRVRLLDCVEKDAVAFEPLSRAYGIPKDDPTRDEIMEKCLHDAAAVPLEIFDLGPTRTPSTGMWTKPWPNIPPWLTPSFTAYTSGSAEQVRTSPCFKERRRSG